MELNFNIFVDFRFSFQAEAIIWRIFRYYVPECTHVLYRFPINTIQEKD